MITVLPHSFAIVGLQEPHEFAYTWRPCLNDDCKEGGGEGGSKLPNFASIGNADKVVRGGLKS